MKLAIMQPYFLPYLGYFSLINQADTFILFDTPQFIRHGWIERNKILKMNGESFYVKVPLIKHKRETRINDIAINNAINWKEKMFAQLMHYKKKAPYYQDVILILEDLFSLETDSIVELNYNALVKICQYLGIKTPIKIWSKMNIKIEDVTNPDEWALNICKALSASAYFNPVGGMSFFDTDKYKSHDIDLKFLEIYPTIYNQFGNAFTPFLSIIDVIMFNDKDEINNMVNNFNWVVE